MSDYIYVECPDCEYSMVIRGGEHLSCPHCPLCLSDCGRSVEMSRRPAEDEDEPEGRDEREGQT